MMNQLNKRNLVLLFKSLIRPHLEYMNQIWSPHKKKDIQEIESVQRRATKLVPELKNKTYQERLKILELPTLVYRRLRGDMIETYKIINIYDSNAVPNITKESHSRTRGHSQKIVKRRSITNLRQNFFTQRIVNTWNGLPNYVVTAPSLDSFKRRLDSYWSDLELKYNYEAPLA